MKHILPLHLLLLLILNIQTTKAQNPYTIPVVFHILYENPSGPENIGDSQVVNAMAILNQDFNKQNADVTEAIPQFVNIIADAGIEFKLALIDPNGKPTTGIDRIDTSLTNIGGDTAKINQWDPARYLNIWTVKDFIEPNDYYSPLSHVDSFPAIDGVEVLSTGVGNTGSSNQFNTHTLTHLVGHWLCLLHPWGATSTPGVTCGDDSVSDTPITKGWQTCPGADTSAAKICDPLIVENYQNFMEYSYCSVMFTDGQSDRMHNCLNSPLAHRNNIWSTQNLIATGLLADTTGILENAFPNLSVYPNPFEQQVLLHGLPDGLFDISVFDVTGRAIMNKENIIPAEGDITLFLSSSLSPGLYFLKLSSGESYRVVKLVKD